MESLKLLLPVVVATTFVVGGVAMTGQDLINSATVAQQSMNFRQILETVELYNAQFGEYPKIEGETAAERWGNLIDFLAEKNYIYSLNYNFVDGYDYRALEEGRGFYLKAGEDEIKIER